MPRLHHLPRLRPEWYRGEAIVFWTDTIEKRTAGWLNPDFHQRFREVLLHASVRYAISCPVYTLLPDHWHWIGIGAAPSADQARASRFLRSRLQPRLSPARLQPQAYDHVLRQEERERDAFRSTLNYLLQNPVRASLVSRPQDWPYRGTLVPGFPDLDPFQEQAEEEFWKCHRLWQQTHPTAWS